MPAISPAHALGYVDWAWGYICPVADTVRFKDLLARKLKAIAG